MRSNIIPTLPPVPALRRGFPNVSPPVKTSTHAMKTVLSAAAQISHPTPSGSLGLHLTCKWFHLTWELYCYLIHLCGSKDCFA